MVGDVIRIVPITIYITVDLLGGKVFEEGHHRRHIVR
jgi:hypothetical protein